MRTKTSSFGVRPVLMDCLGPPNADIPADSCSGSGSLLGILSGFTACDDGCDYE